MLTKNEEEARFSNAGGDATVNRRYMNYKN